MTYTQKVTIENSVLYQGDCIEVMSGMADNSVDSIVCDPPYLLGFMGKAWDAADGIAGKPEVWREALRVLKPGGHLLAFGAPRTNHRMVTAIEDAGFEIRDSVMYIFGSGFPKSMDVSKAIDGHITKGRSDSLALKQVNNTRPGEATVRLSSTNGHRGIVGSGNAGLSIKRSTPATPAAKKWQGWGTALKPAFEPICVARKPLDKSTVAANVLHWGTGALNIDGCRIGQEKVFTQHTKRPAGDALVVLGAKGTGERSEHMGRWPANIILDGSPEVIAGFPETKTGGAPTEGNRNGNTFAEFATRLLTNHGVSEGSAARFFYTAKASKSDRDEGLDGLPDRVLAMSNQAKAELIRGNMHAGESGMNTAKVRKNHHPTVKPTDLMKYLCRLVTPPGGTVLDIFMGSGSTGKAAAIEGFAFIGIEREAEYFEISQARIKQAHAQGQLFAPVQTEPEQLLIAVGGHT